MQSSAAAALLVFLGASIACDMPRRARDPQASAPPLPPGLIVVEPPSPDDAPRPPPRATLPDATEVVDRGEFRDAGLERFDLGAALAAGTVSIESNDPSFMAKVDTLFDGDPETLSRTDSINPLELTLRFEEPVRLAAARVVLAGSTYDWLIEPVAGEGRHLLRDVPERVWSPFRMPEPVSTSAIRFEMLRLERDDYVHVSELELWIEGER